MLTLRLRLPLVVALALPAGSFGQTWVAELSQARPGTTVAVPAGTHRGAVTIPPGVTLRGAGMTATVLDTRGAPAGVTFAPGAGACLEDVTVITSGTGVLAAEVGEVTIRRVLVREGMIGVQLRNVAKARVENGIIHGAHIGLTASGVTATTVVNNTLVDNDACALSLANVADTAVFNNLVENAGTAIAVGGANRNLAVDHNLYVALTIGKLDGQFQRPSLPTWRDVSGGLDAHSVQLPVAFANPKRQDFHPVTPLTWNPARLTTADWGTATLAGHAAPPADADGQPRAGAPDVGAYEGPELTGIRLDGTFSIETDAGVKSVGLFAPNGRLVNYLFHGLPLKRGTHGFVLPARDVFGRPVPPGEYELRIAESALRWEYRRHAFNVGVDNLPENAASIHISHLAFGHDGALLTGSSWSERHINLRSSDAANRKTNWTFGGSSDSAGLCVGADGLIYYSRRDADKLFSLYRINPANGQPVPLDDGRLLQQVQLDTQRLGGIAELDGMLYIAVSDANRLQFGPAAGAAFERTVEVVKPSSPAADRARHLLWLIADRARVLALKPDGSPAHTFAGVEMPLALAVAADRLAVASGVTGKIHLFDLTDPAQPKPLTTLGRGDGPFGPWLPDRFHFQAHARQPQPGLVALALAADGTLALRDASNRLVVFDPKGQALYDGLATWGGDPTEGAFAGDTRVRSFEGAVSVLLDAKAGTCVPEALWSRPPLTKPDQRGFFNLGGHNFALFTCENPEKAGDPWVVIANADQPVMRAVLAFRRNAAGAWAAVRDGNGDGTIDLTDGDGEAVTGGDGKPFTLPLTGRFVYVNADGVFYHSNQPMLVIARPRGLDAQGVPQYDFTQARFEARDATVPNPYDLVSDENLNGCSTAEVLPDGSVLACHNLRTTPRGMGFSNSGATDLGRWNSDGSFRWFRCLNDYSPVQRVETVGDLVLSSWGHQAEFMALDHDGLELGRFGFPAAANWNGFWVDHPQEWFAAKGNDGNVQIVVGDYVTNSHHWFTVYDAASVTRRTVKVELDAAGARRLAYRRPLPYPQLAAARAPEVRIKKLGGPLTLDGELAKWRGFPPQILLTPQNSFGRIEGAGDLCGVARLAYHGRDLYGQLIAWDDRISFHQPAERFYKADSMQFCINGFLQGFGFSIAQTLDKGAFFLRNRFYFQNMNLDLDPAKAPRVIRLLPDGTDIPERTYIESVYGIDLSKTPAYVYEFKLPLDESTYQGDEKIIPEVQSGKWFWFGFMLNDNDDPGTDIQYGIVWPGTFGMFAQPEAGAKAYFE